MTEKLHILAGQQNEATSHEHSSHEHHAVIAHALRQQAGIPYEIEQRVCTDCHRVLDERTVRRAAA